MLGIAVGTPVRNPAQFKIIGRGVYEGFARLGAEWAVALI
jgi:hypothetical protein